MAWIRRRWLVLAFVGVVVAAWASAVVWLLVDARSSVDRGQAALSAVRADATPSSLLDPATDGKLDAADRDFDRARERLRNPLISPLRAVPVVGRHIRAADHLVSAASEATALGGGAIDELQALAERPLAAGPERIEALESLADIVGRVGVGLGELEPGSGRALIRPLGEAVDDLRSERDDAVASLQRAEDATRAVATLLDGPSSYLLIGANNAEMRAGSGMFLSAAPLDFESGKLLLGEVMPTEQMVLPAGSVEVGGDLAANWPWLDPGRDLRNMALTADFPQSAALARANWAKVPGGGEVAGVIVVDVDALRALLRVVGPVEVDGIRYTADTVRGELLHEQYRRFEDDRDERRDQLGEVARAVFTRIESGDWKLDELATAMVEAVQGRHVLIWSADPKVQEAWSAAGADGELKSNSLSVAMLNRGSEKLDSYLDTTAVVESKRRTDGRVGVTISYTITNRAPIEGPRYLIGPNLEGMVAGEHRGIVLVNLPGGSTDVALTGARQFLSGPDGPTVVAGAEVDLKRGETLEVVVTAVLPRGMGSVALEPPARIPRTRWTVDGNEFRTDRRRTVTLGG